MHLLCCCIWLLKSKLRDGVDECLLRASEQRICGAAAVAAHDPSHRELGMQRTHSHARVLPSRLQTTQQPRP